MMQTLQCLNYPRLWELWYIPYNGSCRIYIINRMGPLQLDGLTYP